ncbi:hypothetical protein [Nocardioides currus]|uniref:Uncharacterized protein n=1 Tax=Nocardioides currus TaxID=2133958 RepID=A0A2R7YSX2_9ACTN|nr:hypothetical protein [Nocardioides currus]PUA79495.1 hypothetical protein C7S10_19190 [Nocardioides currus]
MDALEEAWREEQQVRARAAAQARDAAEQDAARATAFIRDIWARTGTGPTWTELGEAMAWPPQLRARVIRLLARDGVLLYSSAPRSLAVVDGSDDE